MHADKDLGLGSTQMEFKSLPLNKLGHLNKFTQPWGKPLCKVEKMTCTLQKYFEDEMA